MDDSSKQKDLNKIKFKILDMLVGTMESKILYIETGCIRWRQELCWLLMPGHLRPHHKYAVTELSWGLFENIICGIQVFRTVSHFSSVLNTPPFLMLLFMASLLLLAAGRGRVVTCDHVTTVLSPVRWGQQPALLTSYSRRSGMCLWLLWLQETAWLQLCAAAFF